MATAPARRDVVAFFAETYGLSQRRGCRLVRLPRATCRYRQRPCDRAALPPAFASGRQTSLWLPPLACLLHREGGARRYSKGLSALSRRGSRRAKPSAQTMGSCENATAAGSRPQARRAMDFVPTTLAGQGRRLRTRNIVEVFTPECLAIEADFSLLPSSLPGARVVRVLERLRDERGYPWRLRSTMVSSLSRPHWAHGPTPTV